MMMQNETSQNKMLLSSDYYLKRWYNSVVRDGLQADRRVLPLRLIAGSK